MGLGRRSFGELLIDWYEAAQRDLPWRRTRDPYAIWVSEIMLQQTRVAAVIPFYSRFLARFPTLRELAGASESDILGAWAGLGYYTRVRNMQRAAQEMSGKFPDNYDAIRALPGIGDYTAAAVGSIAFGLPYAAVDGNVLRVMSRVWNDSGDISTGPVRKRLGAAAQSLLDVRRPGEFNQALMELGATICLPKQPQCLVCPVADVCEARAAGTQNDLPVTGKRVATVRVRRRLLVVSSGTRLLMWQRPASSTKLAGFWELPEPEHLPDFDQVEIVGEFRHSITNHEYTFEVAVVRGAMSGGCKQVVNCRWIARKALGNMALSTTARKALALCGRISHGRDGIELTRFTEHG